MLKCPVCNHKLYGEEKGKRYCKFCGYTNDPKKLEELKYRDSIGSDQENFCN